MATATEERVPLNGLLPVRSSNRITPSDQTSERPSTSRLARCCSGDMYGPVPTVSSVLVSRECSSSLVEVETPKSRTRTSRRSVPGSSLRNRFPGFKSR